MSSLFLFPEEYLFDRENFNCSEEEHVWTNSSSKNKELILYSVITPIICFFGICGNALSLIVLRRRKLIGSVYTYLAMMATMDLLMSIVMFIEGISRGIVHHEVWATYNALYCLPLTGVIKSLSILATVGVTIDRVVFLWNPVQCTKPRFCNPKIARRLMTAGLILSILFNLPYCFIFRRDERRKLKTTQFFDSKVYVIYNWFMLIFLTIFPAIVLMFGNGFLIMSLRNARKVSVKCNGKKRKDHTNLTVILLCIIILFLCCEIPSSLVSRAKAVSILFGGNHKRDNSRTIENLRDICTLLGAINVTASYLFYYLFSPAFRNDMLKVVNMRKRCKKNVQINVYLVNDESNQRAMEATLVEVTKSGIDTAFPALLLTNPVCSSNMQLKLVPKDNDFVEVIAQSMGVKLLPQKLFKVTINT